MCISWTMTMPALYCEILNYKTKHLFENEIENAILENGNLLNIYDTIDLYLARK